MRCIVICGIVLCYLFCSPETIMHNGNPWIVRAILHNFLHGNVFHLASNIMMLWLLYPNMRKHRMLIFGLSLIIATASFAVSDGDSIGLSDVLYATMGLSALPLKSKWWQTPIAKFFLLSFLVAFLLPNISAMTHLVSYIVGFVTARCIDKCQKLGDDYCRAGGCNTKDNKGE